MTTQNSNIIETITIEIPDSLHLVMKEFADNRGFSMPEYIKHLFTNTNT